MLEYFVNNIMERVASGKIAIPVNPVSPIYPGNLSYPKYPGTQRNCKKKQQPSHSGFPDMLQEALQGVPEKVNEECVETPHQIPHNNFSGINNVQNRGSVVDNLVKQYTNPGTGMNVDIVGEEREAGYKDSLNKQKEIIDANIDRKRKDIERLQKQKDQKNKQLENMKPETK